MISSYHLAGIVHYTLGIVNIFFKWSDRKYLRFLITTTPIQHYSMKADIENTEKANETFIKKILYLFICLIFLFLT